MLICTSWKARPLTREQADRLMAIWGKLEADLAENPAVERVCWFLDADGGGGFTVDRVADADAAVALNLEASLALGEFMEIETRPVLDLDAAMPAIMRGMERLKA
jgi:hypothetical protein